MFKVMLVDDEMFTRQGMRALIDWETFGFQIIGEADNGEDALILIRDIKPDLVVTDIRMPVMDGLGLIKHTIEENDWLPRFIIISGYSDFNYAQRAVRYGVFDFILKPIDEVELVEALKRLKDEIEEDRLFSGNQEELKWIRSFDLLMKGDALVVEELEELTSFLHCGPKDEVRYCMIEVNDQHPWSEQEHSLSPDEIKEVFSSIIEYHLNLEQAIFINEHHKHYGFILTEKHLHSMNLTFENMIRRIQADLEKRLNYPIYMYIGESISIEKLSNSYQSAKGATQYKFIKGAGPIIFHEQIQDQEIHFISLSPSMLQRLLEQVEEQRSDEMQQTVNRIFNEFQKKHYAPEAVKLAIHQCVTGIIDIVRRLEGDEKKLVSLEPIVSWHDLNLTSKELKRLFIVFLEESSEVIGKQRKDSIKGGIQKIKNYIEASYQQNINLKSIAAKFYMNPVYLGQLFKKTYGMYFNEFLLQLRVTEAKKLLRQTDLRVYEIAEKIGFNNADYFVTQFEKSEGITPTEYRNKLLNQQ